MQRAKWIRWFALALAIVVTCLWFAIDSSRDHTMTAPDVAVPVAAASSTDSVHNAPLASEVSTAPDDEPEPQRAPVASVTTSTAADVDHPGTLIVTATDPTSLGPLRWFRVRVANATRFAERHSNDGERDVELPLSSGDYSVCVSSPGYETVQIPSAKVARGETSRLDPIVLEPGRARIHVQVIGAPDRDRQLTVELMGDGRHPCARCVGPDDISILEQQETALRRGSVVVQIGGTPTIDSPWNRTSRCAACGYARDLSRAFLHCGESFTFTNLASGGYALRLVNSDGQMIGESAQMLLEPGATRSIEFDAYATRSVAIELFDADGRSLAEEWKRRLAGDKSGAEIVDGYDDDGSFRVVFSDDRRDVANVTFHAPSANGHRLLRPSAFGGRKLGDRIPKSPSPIRAIDRDRKPGDTLCAVSPTPFFEPTPVNCRLENDGMVTIEPLPSSPLKLHVTAANVSGEAIVQATKEKSSRIRVWLHAQ